GFKSRSAHQLFFGLVPLPPRRPLLSCRTVPDATRCHPDLLIPNFVARREDSSSGAVAKSCHIWTPPACKGEERRGGTWLRSYIRPVRWASQRSPGLDGNPRVWFSCSFRRPLRP